MVLSTAIAPLRFADSIALWLASPSGASAVGHDILETGLS